MESNETVRKPIVMRTYVGVTVFFNPHWVAEIKTGARPVTILRHNKFHQYNQRTMVIYTLINAYHIPVRWWVEHYNPLSRSILFSMSVAWRISLGGDFWDAEHIIECPKRHKLVEEKEDRTIKFSYLDVERVEHRDGTVLWQKQR